MRTGSMKTQFIMMMIGSSLFTLLFVAGFFIRASLSQADNQIAQLRDSLVTDIENQLRQETETAISGVNQIYRQQQAGLLTEEQAKIAAADLVRNLRYDNGAGYFWVDTYEGVNVVLLGRQETEGKSRINATDPTGKQFIREMIQNGRQAGGGFTDLMFAKPGESTPLPKRNYTAAFEPYQWVIGTGVWIDHIDARVAEEQKILDENFNETMMYVAIGIAIVEVILFIAAGVLAGRMIDPITKLTAVLKTLATGDFRKNGSFDSINTDMDNEIGAMGRAVLSMKKNIRSMMGTVVVSAEQVAAASEQLTASADQSANAIHLVADSIVNVAGACTEQFTAVEEATTQTDKLAENMEHFKNTLDDATSRIHATNTAAKEGETNVGKAVNQMQLIESSVSESARVISELGEESDKIGKIVDAISGIAEQTNLLALNAAIEAARAGEHGRGFAVVADEVRKLAEQSQTSAHEISELIGSIQEKSQNAVKAMQSGVERVQSGTEAVDNARQTFREIADMVMKVNDNSGKMEEIVDKLSDSSGVIAKSVDKINEKSRDVARESETVSASSEEQTATMHEIADASRSLATMAQDMQNALSQFKI
ncbi:MAG: cache domain-containing protein [Selenomonadaceae bacterium]|nr:cache domain-containing protein [Selenomonadaceae bacterium]